MGQARFEILDRHPRLPEAFGQFREDGAPRVSSEQRIGGCRGIELPDRIVDPGYALEQRDLTRDACLHDRLQTEKEHAPIRLLARQADEELVALPLAMRCQELLQRRQHDDGLGIRVRGDVEQRLERTRLCGGQLPGGRGAASGECERGQQEGEGCFVGSLPFVTNRVLELDTHGLSFVCIYTYLGKRLDRSVTRLDQSS
jgi:hypothetical protein